MPILYLFHLLLHIWSFEIWNLKHRQTSLDDTMLRFVPSLPNTNQLSSDDAMRLKFVINGPMNDFWNILEWMQLPITRLAYSFIQRQICSDMFHWKCLRFTHSRSLMLWYLNFREDHLFIYLLFVDGLDLPWFSISSNQTIKFNLNCSFMSNKMA